METKTLCPVPWMSQSLWANGDIRVSVSIELFAEQFK